MLLNKITEYCLSKYKAYEDYPFGDIPICYKLNNKIFAQIYPNPNDLKITLKCTADTGQFYRRVYPKKLSEVIIVHLYNNHTGIQFI